MQRLLKVFFLTCALATGVAAQNISGSVPVRWERYRAEEKNASAIFPKMPVLLPDNSKKCFGEESAQYAAYAHESVYAVRVTYKVKPFEYCSEKKKFSEKNFEERLKEIRNLEAEKREVPVAATDKATAKFVGKYWIRLLFNDAKNERWFELYVASRDLNKPAVNNFLESLQIGQQTEGIEIGNGAPTNFGDASEQNQPAKTNSGIVNGTGSGDGSGDGAGSGSGSTTVKTGDGQNKNEISDPLVLVFKPRANYTDAARKDNVQGTVRLRVIFLANGGIGSIGVVSGLPQGLTEQAIAAAKKLFFLPPRRNQVQYSVAKLVEYQFSLY